MIEEFQWIWLESNYDFILGNYFISNSILQNQFIKWD